MGENEFKNNSKLEEYVEQRKQKKEPDFSNVSVGQVWSGRSRRNNFIIDLGLVPKKSGSHSGNAQDKYISEYCNYENNKNTKELVLKEIYQEKHEKEKQQRKKKYDNQIEKIITYYLNRDGYIQTTKKNLFKTLGIFPSEYLSMSVGDCIEKLDSEKNLVEYNIRYKILENTNDKLLNSYLVESYSEKDLSNNLKVFHEETYQIIRQIYDIVLKRLEEDGKIVIDEYDVIVINKGDYKVYVMDTDAMSIDLTYEEVHERLYNANEYAIENTFIKKLNRNAKSIEEVHHYKQYKKYKEKYDDYLKEKYSWEYTYREIKITKGDKISLDTINEKECLTLKNELNSMLIKRVYDSLMHKDKKLRSDYEKEYENISMNLSSDIRELIDVTVYKESDIINPTQYTFPNDFPKYLERFIMWELTI